VTRSADEIANLEKDLAIDIRAYRFNIKNAIQTVQIIEAVILQPLASVISFPGDCYKRVPNEDGVDPKDEDINDSQRNFINSVNQIVNKLVQEDQDTQVLKFLNGRNKLIQLDSQYTKANLNIQDFKNYEDRVLVILCIIILKNINNLLIEIGPLAVKAFLLDLKRDLLVTGSQKQKLGKKAYKAIDIIDNFCSGV
jgi:hypothetical protein